MYPRRTLPVQGFTLIEILVVIGMIAALAGIVLVAVNPLRQFAQARNAQRESDVNVLINAIGERLADKKGVFNDTDGCPDNLPSGTEDIASQAYDLRPCLVPTYVSELPVDPSGGSITCSDFTCRAAGDGYAIGYTVKQDPTTSRITVCAPAAAESALPGSQAYCITR